MRFKIFLRIIVVAFCLLFNSVAATYIYSFFPTMMVDLGLSGSTTTSGKAASWIASSMMVGRTLTSHLWGRYIDTHGRKQGLLLSIFLITVVSVFFGFAKGFWYVLVVRFLLGASNGLSAIGKVLTTEVCPPEYKAISVSITSTIWNLGGTLGPFFGAQFYKMIPAYPYLASSLFIVVFGIIMMILAFFVLKETLPEEAMQKNQQRGSHVEHQQLQENNSDSLVDQENLSVVRRTFQSRVSAWCGNVTNDLRILISIPNLALLMAIYCINTFYANVISEIIPFWSAAQYQDGGLSFSPKDTSQLFLYLTIPQILTQLVGYPMLQKAKGDYWLLVAGHVAYGVFFFFAPFAHWMAEDEKLEMKLWLVFWLVIKCFGNAMNFSALQVFTNGVIRPEKRGLLNGYQIAFSSLFQAAGPFVGAWLLAWSMETVRSYPFNYHFAFLFMVGVTIGALNLIRKLRFSDHEKKKLIGDNNSQQ